MAAGKPIILGVGGESKEILLSSRAGLAIQPEDADALASSILSLQKEPSLCRALGRNGRQAALDKYLRPVQADKYLDLLHDLSARPQPFHSRELTFSHEFALRVLSNERTGATLRPSSQFTVP